MSAEIPELVRPMCRPTDDATVRKAGVTIADTALRLDATNDELDLALRVLGVKPEPEGGPDHFGLEVAAGGGEPGDS